MAAANHTYQDTKTEMQKRMQFVAERIGQRWKRLAIQLSIDSHVIDGADADFARVEEKAFEVLSRWCKACGQAATIETLIEALKTINEKSIAEQLEQQLGLQPKENVEPKHLPKHPGEASQPAVPQAVASESLIKIFDIELNRMLKNCTDNLTTGDRSTLVHDFNMVQHVQKLNTVLLKLTNKYGDDDDDVLKSCRIRGKQADQTMRLILQMQSSEQDRTLIGCTDFVKIKMTRSFTADNISRPTGISKPCIVEREITPFHSRNATYDATESALPRPSNESCEDQTSNEEPIQHTVPPESLRIFDEGLTAMLKKFTDNFTNCGCPPETVQVDVQQVQKLNNALLKMIDSQKYSNENGTEIEKIKKTCEKRGQEARQTLTLVECMSNLQAANPDSAGKQASLEENCNQTMQPDKKDQAEETKD